MQDAETFIGTTTITLACSSDGIMAVVSKAKLRAVLVGGIN
jgi:hypothetical protein